MDRAPVPVEISVGPLARPVLDPDEIARLNRRFERAEADEIVAWAAARFGSRLVLASSFGDTVLIDLVIRTAPDVEVVFCDTGFHFGETLETLRRAMDRYGLNLTVLRPAPDAVDLWEHGSDACCRDRKMAPLERHLAANADAWLSGLRRADSPGRASAPIVGIDRRGLVKVNPLARWSDADVASYTKAHDVIVNPLVQQGYPSIGCWPCTERPVDGDQRSGRWLGAAKTECGIHL